MLFDSRAAPACYTPTAPTEKDARGGGKREEEALKYTSHMKVTSLQPGEITGPDGKVTAGRRH